jgi:hypothetical protein
VAPISAISVLEFSGTEVASGDNAAVIGVAVLPNYHISNRARFAIKL